MKNKILLTLIVFYLISHHTIQAQQKLLSLDELETVKFYNNWDEALDEAEQVLVLNLA